MSDLKRVLILGATGSIGVNSLKCVDNCPECFNVTGLSTHTRVAELLAQAAKYRPSHVAVTGRDLTGSEAAEFQNLNITAFTGEDALVRLVRETEYDLLVNAVVGAAGFVPTLRAIEKGAAIALANKETLVVGGELVMQKAAEKNCEILPIDSEHSAIFQSLMGESRNSIEEILLTASGGPFRNLENEQFRNVTVEQALAHPNWNMGRKITIDSATMMNKGLEVIEAQWLFHVPVGKVKVVVHPQSIIHSMVAFHDGSIKAQLGVPDMRVPIQLAMTYPQRLPSDFPRLDFWEISKLTFEKPDLEKFHSLALAYKAVEMGGVAAAVLNAANELAVERFLQRDIRFDQIPLLIETALETHSPVTKPGEQELIEADHWGRKFAAEYKLN